MRINKENRFVRFGRLDRYNFQKVWVGNCDGYHAAPTRRGFYAMPYIFQEPFLIGSLEATQPELAIKFHDPFPDKKVYDMTEAEREAHDRALEKYRASKRKNLYRHQKIFDLDDLDLVWTHLCVDRNEACGTSGSWTKCTVSAYKKACRRQFHSGIDRDDLEVFISPR